MHDIKQLLLLFTALVNNNAPDLMTQTFETYYRVNPEVCYINKLNTALARHSCLHLCIIVNINYSK